MPPSTHYLNLLNLNQTEDNLQQEEFTDADISKQLELFTNSNFLDTEPFAYQPFDASAYDAQLSNQPNGDASNNERYRSSSVTAPRSGRQQFQPPMQPASRNSSLPVQDLANLDYIHQFNNIDGSNFTNSPVGAKRNAEEAEMYSATPASSDVGGEDRKGGKTLDEEDKRRRNTAASARFRIKKKQREQALQESAKAMTDKNAALESRVRELELENKWLRSLLKPVNAEQTKNVLASI